MTTPETELLNQFLRDLSGLLEKYTNSYGTEAGISAEMDRWGTSCKLNVYIPSQQDGDGNETTSAIDFDLPWNCFEAGDGEKVICLIPKRRGRIRKI